MPVCASCGHESSEGFKFCPECGAPATTQARAREQRKTVTVLFCDVTGSTALGEFTDPEALRALLARYFERMKSILEAHGGTVEKFIGDAVMAVFGVPQVHEDDALRACRAAVEMRDALPELGVRARIGVNTGEVVTGTEERLATGDAVNVAARLEQAAKPSEVLIGEETLALVRDAVEADPVEPLELKGKAEAVRAHRLGAVTGELVRRDAAPMVGRETELRRLRDAYEQAVHDGSCQLFTMLGSAGVGKSRLAYEFLAGLDAWVVRGRCLSYGEGITYFPVVEIVQQLREVELDPTAESSLRSLLGESDDPATADEIAWAFRKLLEAAAQPGPLIVVFDDLHWGEETLLDLVEHVADLARGAPILLLCMARPELLEKRLSWGGGKLNATTVLLEPLSADETQELIQALAGDLAGDIADRLVYAAEGNPLFVEEMIELARASGDAEVVVPPTIQALLAARLDQLDPSERGVLERGAVEGRVFHRGAVEALAPDEHQVPQRLVALVRKELVRPDTTELPGEDAFRFRHLLIRDAAYDALPKAARAELHERFALWLEEHGTGFVELDEIVGYHFEQACRYRDELGLARDPSLVVKARERLAAAGYRARARGDEGAAVNLLERAVSLLGEGENEFFAECELAEACFWAGDAEKALRLVDSLARRGASSGDRTAELCGRIRIAMYEGFLGKEQTADELDRLVAEALPVFEAEEDHRALYVAYRSLGQVANMRALMDDGADAMDRGAFHARAARLPFDLVGWRTMFRFLGTRPLPDLIAWLDEQNATGAREHIWRARALASLGHIDEAREDLKASIAKLEEQGARMRLAGVLSQDVVEVELRAGNPVGAVEAGERGCRIFEEAGERGFLSTSAAMLANAYCELGNLDRAEAWALHSKEIGAEDDVVTQMLWRQALARVRARRGEHAEAELLASEAVERGRPTQMLDMQANAYADLAEVLELAGRDPRGALEEALERYERRGNVVMAARTRERLAGLPA